MPKLESSAYLCRKVAKSNFKRFLQVLGGGSTAQPARIVIIARNFKQSIETVRVWQRPYGTENRHHAYTAKALTGLSSAVPSRFACSCCRNFWYRICALAQHRPHSSRGLIFQQLCRLVSQANAAVVILWATHAAKQRKKKDDSNS